jgi:transcriptional regulator with XRE-family HTH domain
MPHTLPVGRALLRFRRLNAIKQGHAAELLGVSQGSVSRWESGTHEPDEESRARIVALIGAKASRQADAVLKQLVQSSALPVHLVCDSTHVLLAASPAREASWKAETDVYLGQSLWRFASREIVEAEQGLASRGWFDSPFQSLRFWTGDNMNDELRVLPSHMQWDTIPLSDGRIGRLTTTVG